MKKYLQITVTLIPGGAPTVFSSEVVGGATKKAKITLGLSRGCVCVGYSQISPSVVNSIEPSFSSSSSIDSSE